MRLASLCFAIAISLSTVAFAQDATSPAAVTPVDAREAFRRGQAAYSAGNYDQAVREWQGAYKVDPRPLIQFNLSQAYERMGYFSKRAIGQLPPGEQPSAVNYWKQHTLAEMTDRLVSGMPQQANNFLSFDEFSKRRKKAQQRTRVILPFRGAYLFVLGGVTLGLAVSTRRAPEPCEIRRSRVALWLLTGLAFAAHFLAFSFYTPIAPGARLIMCAYLPVLFALAMGIETLRARSQQRWLEILYRGIYVAVAVALLGRMVFLSGAKEFGEIRGAF